MENENTTLSEGKTDAAGTADDGFDGIDLSDLQPEGETAGDETTNESENEETDTGKEADQQNSQDREEGQQKDESETGKSGAEQKPDEKQGETDQSFELKHLDEVRKVGRDEVITLAQKGLDYDHIRQERDSNRIYRDFIKDLADKQKITPEDLMDTIKANLLVEDEKSAGRTVDQATALERVKLERERKAFEAEKKIGAQQQEQETETMRRRRDGFLQFAKEYPDVDAKTIPKEVWDKVNAGGNLADAYARFDNKRLKEENEKLRQNQSNKDKTTGSRKTAGAASKEDAFDSLWYNGE